MNSLLVNVAIEDCLFFDIETVHRNKVLEVDSKEFELFQWKNRDRETDELLSEKEVQELYLKRGALTAGFNKIVAIGAAYVRDNKVHTKVYRGDEESILRDFAITTNHFGYFVSFNGINFDVPMTIVNSARYFQPHGEFKGTYNSSGKKPWDLKNHIDLMEAVKGTFYNNMSFDEACYMYGVKSPKEGGIKGSTVSKVYWEEGDDKIVDYVREDVIALVNLFSRLRFKEAPTLATDTTEVIEDKPLITLLREEQDFNTRVKEKLQPILSKVKNKEDLEILKDIVFRCSIKSELFKTDDKLTVDTKKFEVEEFFKII